MFYAELIILVFVHVQFKVVFRIHYTRARLKKLFPDTDEFCIRCSQSPADHTHTWCPLIAMFGVSLVVGRFTSYQADVIAFAALKVSNTATMEEPKDT